MKLSSLIVPIFAELHEVFGSLWYLISMNLDGNGSTVGKQLNPSLLLPGSNEMVEVFANFIIRQLPQFIHSHRSRSSRGQAAACLASGHRRVLAGTLLLAESDVFFRIPSQVLYFRHFLEVTVKPG